MARHLPSSARGRRGALARDAIGARQNGKSTLVQDLTPGERRFLSLDDLDVADLADRDPEALVGGSTPIILDEIQREPELLSTGDRNWLELLRAEQGPPEDWRTGAAGFPAVHMKTQAERAVWFDDYVRTTLERDLQALSAISALPDFRRLMRAASLRLGQLVNQTELSRDVALPQPTASTIYSRRSVQ